MKVVALGGAGDMGSRGVQELAGEEEVESILIADYDEQKARAFASKFGKKCTATKVDANDHSSLVEVIKGHDVAMSAIGPFYKYEQKVAKAAVAAGVNYVSICDDYDAAEALFGLDSDAKKANVTVLTGLGWTPGISNVLARMGAERLDSVDEIAVAWGGSANDSEGYAVILHTIHIFTGFVPSFQNGRLKMVPAGSDREKILFPAPMGEIFVYHLGHPEPVTIPRYIPASTVTLKGGLMEEEMNTAARILSKLHLTSTEERKDRVGKVIKALSPVMFKIGKPETPISALRVDVSGIKAKKRESMTFGCAAHMNDLTGIPLAIGALMLGRGQIEKKGVNAPEGCVDPGIFLDELGKRGIKVFEGAKYEKTLN
ncbi:MAG: saccharopine dehydrogenase NADP-binding domain-containing protein [Actinomycetota bacterium]|nr:saccharopine dehydrogenase NADP-binding domain-containing protein [Actinomycetota bacterium]